MLRQILIVCLVFIVSNLGLRALGVPLAGLITVALSCVAVVACLRINRESWAGVGLTRVPRPLRMLLQGLGIAMLGYATAIAATVLATRVIGLAPMETARFAGMQGNLPMLLGMLAVSWTTAAFGEELLFRGFLQSRLQSLFSRWKFSGVAASLLQALAFGLVHAYQGPTGVLASGSIGLVFGLLMLRTRSIWPLVIAHGVVDSVSMLALYAGAFPGA